MGNSLAIRVPAAAIEALQLKEGDEIEIHVARGRGFDASRKLGRAEPLTRFENFAGGSPPISSTTGKR